MNRSISLTSLSIVLIYQLLVWTAGVGADTAVATVRDSGGAQLPGEQAFALHDTYGFPIDLTLEMAAEQGLSVDEEGFRRLMGQQRERAKADSQARKAGVTATTAYRDILQAGGTTTFTGYNETVTESEVIGIVKDGDTVPAARVGDHVEVVLNRTPFYAEAGGQLGDHGRLRSSDGATVDVYDVQTPVPGLFIHRGEVVDGELLAGATVMSEVDEARRRAISRAHTATHMIHKAFRERLGETATQMGSENAPGRLRFDFPNPTPVPAEVMRDVEQVVNEVLIEDLSVSAHTMTQDQARAMGAMALFGEKYGDIVRVLEIGNFSKELCGGTHVSRLTEIGLIKLVSEGSVGANLRRIEAVTSKGALDLVDDEEAVLDGAASSLRCRPQEVADKVAAFQKRLKDAEKAAHAAASSIDASEFELWSTAAGYPVHYGRLDGVVADALRDAADRVRGSDGAVVIVGVTGFASWDSCRRSASAVDASPISCWRRAC